MSEDLQFMIGIALIIFALGAGPGACAYGVGAGGQASKALSSEVKS